jgi:hypothetical protein
LLLISASDFHLSTARWTQASQSLNSSGPNFKKAILLGARVSSS